MKRKKKNCLPVIILVVSLCFFGCDRGKGTPAGEEKSASQSPPVSETAVTDDTSLSSGSACSPEFNLSVFATVKLTVTADFDTLCDDLVKEEDAAAAHRRARERLDRAAKRTCAEGIYPSKQSCLPGFDRLSETIFASEKLDPEGKYKSCYLTCELNAQGRCVFE